MNFIGMIGLVCAGDDRFFTSQKLSVTVDPRNMLLAGKPAGENPIHLDAIKNGLYPINIITAFRNPNFIGTPPPGVLKFMHEQAILAGGKKGGFVYPLLSKEAVEQFNGEKIVLEDSCKKNGGKGCPAGYKKVTSTSKDAKPEAEESGTPKIVPAPQTISTADGTTTTSTGSQ